MFGFLYIGLPFSTATADWGSVSVKTDQNGWLKVILENSKIRVIYRHFSTSGGDQHAIRDLVIKSVNEDQVKDFIDAQAGRGPLKKAVIVEDGINVKTVRLEWDNGAVWDKGARISEVSIFPDSNYIKFDYIGYGVNVVDIGNPGISNGNGKYEIYGASQWKRGYVTYPKIYFDRFPEHNGHHNITQVDESGPLDYNGWFIMGVFNENNGRGFGRVMPIAQTDIIKLLFKKGFEFFPTFNRKKESYTGYVFVVTGGANEILSMGKKLADGLVDSDGNWKFEEGSGTTAADSSSNGNNGTIKGATWATGINGGGLSFDGSNNYVSVPVMNNEEISISSWFYKDVNDTTNADAIFGAYKRNADVRLREGFDLRFPKWNPDKLQFILVTEDQAGNRTQKIAQKDLGDSVSKWFHAVGTYNKTTGKQKLYVNGQLAHTQTYPAGSTIVPLIAFPDMRIGHSRTNKGFYNGKIDDVRLYNQALNDQVVQYLYANSAGLEGYWKFEEGSGKIIADSSGNGNYVKSRGATWTQGKNGGGLSFDGSNDYVCVPVMNNEEISISAWFYKNSNDTTYADAIFGAWKWNSDLQLREGFDLSFPKWNPDKLQFILVTEDQAGNRTQKIAQKDLGDSVSEWFHAVGTYNKTTGKQKLYINGNLINTQTHPAGNTIAPLTSYYNMRIGNSRVNNGYFKGKIDEVRVYKRGLSDEEVFDLYNAL